MIREFIVLCFYGITSTLRACGNTVAPFSAMLLMLFGSFLYVLSFFIAFPIPIPQVDDKLIVACGVALMVLLSWGGNRLVKKDLFAIVYKYRRLKNRIRALSSFWFIFSIMLFFTSAIFTQ